MEGGIPIGWAYSTWRCHAKIRYRSIPGRKNYGPGCYPSYDRVNNFHWNIVHTVFVVSNGGAIAVLAPLVIGMAQTGGLDPRPLAFMAAICTSNSLILPTHQVNALGVSSGGYGNADYLKAGSGMTLVFLAITVFHLYFLL